MIKIGQINNLQVIKEVDFGFFLDSGDEDWDEILLPTSSAPKSCEPDEWLNVFIYFDSEDRIIATIHKPYALIGDFALLRVASIEKIGAFMDWGLQKDLFVPFGEQKIRMKADRSYVVRVFLHEASGRIAASSRLDKFVDNTPAEYEFGEEVDLIIIRETELGYKAIINSSHSGFLYENEVFQKLKVGQKLKGYIQKRREDGKIDLSLTPMGYEKVDGIAQEILNLLKKQGGFLPITAKTSPEKIYSTFGVSKKNYKKALGSLYKKRLVDVEDGGIRLVEQPTP